MAMRAVFSPSSLFSFNKTTTTATAAYSAHLPNFPFAPSWRRSSSLLFNIPTAASLSVRRRGRRGKLSPGVAYSAASVSGKSIHDFAVKDIDGKDMSLSKFKGKVLLVVNVASRCGLTNANYTELSHLYEKYKSQGFEILAFPCNQFGGQEPGTNPQIKEFACTRFKAEFPIFDKVDVNGPNTAPVYQFLKSSTGGFLGDLIKWNFEKFLVNGEGKVVERYSPTTSPFQIEKDIKKLLAA
ncbi:probable phospholipid hydroperoxide glutathione peroxidase [Nymphaea colorata]|uniref:probable phospholipid hydroperoxide glutathione peroxidase n=1 Tax=Nymphaea colorata TaxID=210225 RepID=UPI00129EE9FA|nr:probable phospholipid hydroperoxide glutathione peroxidase [Nymphaea colorata]